MVITAVLLLVVAIERWKWPPALAYAGAGAAIEPTLEERKNWTGLIEID